MSSKEETASFVLRFNQKIFENNDGGPEVQWRGSIKHVQGDEEKRFSEFDDAVEFIQSKLQDLTINAMGDKTPEEQKGILAKSFSLWKKMASSYPKLIVDTIKDPKTQVANLQDQLHQVGDNISQKLDIEKWIGASKGDLGEIKKSLDKLSSDVKSLNKKVEKISKSRK